MTFEERFEALTMNLELTARDVADLQKAIAEMQKTTAEMQKTTAEMQKTTADMQKTNTDFQKATVARFAQWEMEKKHIDEKVDGLVDSTKMLLTAVQAQQVRIERVERRA